MRNFLIIIMCISNLALAGGGHGHEARAGAQNVGPYKGIIEASERKGFKLSQEAFKNFEITSKKLNGDGPWTIPAMAIIRSGEEINLFRIRGGFFKRIDFEVMSKNESELKVDSDDLRENDEVVISGLGFLRTAELAVFGGVSHGHSH